MEEFRADDWQTARGHFYLVFGLFLYLPGAAHGLASLRPNDYLQVTTFDGEKYSGLLMEINSVDIIVEKGGRSFSFPIDSVKTIKRRGREIRKGSKIGLVIGGLGGLGFGLLGQAFCNEYGNENSHCFLVIPLSVVIDGGVGAAIGSIFGSAVPRWETIYRRRGSLRPEQASQTFPTVRRIKQGTVRKLGDAALLVNILAIASQNQASAGMVGFELNLNACLKRRFSLGPTAGRIRLNSKEHFPFIGINARYLLNRGSTTPFLVPGLGDYSCRRTDPFVYRFENGGLGGRPLSSVNFLGMNAALGYDSHYSKSRIAFTAKIEWHNQIQSLAEPRHYSAFLLNVGSRTRW